MIPARRRTPDHTRIHHVIKIARENFSQIQNPTVSYRAYNPVCGDEIEIFIELDKNNSIKDISFQGKGCAISLATASMLTELIKNKSLSEIKRLNEKDIKGLLGIQLGLVRTKCATLSLVAINSALSKIKTIEN